MIKIIVILALLTTVKAQYGFNSNPRQQDYSGGRNLQLDTTDDSYQTIGAGPGGYRDRARQQDYSGGRNLQLDTTDDSYQRIGAGPGRNRQRAPSNPVAYNAGSQGRRSGVVQINSRPHNRQYSPGYNTGGRNVQVQTTGPQRGTQYPNYNPATGGRPVDGSYSNYRPNPGGGRYGSSGGPRVMVNGVDYTGVDVNRPGLQINTRPGATQYIGY